MDELKMLEDAAHTAYVASYAWIARRADGMARDYRAEVLREYGMTDAAWNAACDQLADYSRRQGEDRAAEEFKEAKVAEGK